MKKQGKPAKSPLRRGLFVLNQQAQVFHHRRDKRRRNPKRRDAESWRTGAVR